MVSRATLTQIPTLHEQLRAQHDSLVANGIIFFFRRVAKIPCGPMTLSLIIDRHLSDKDREDWIGLQKIFKNMCAEYQKIHARPLISKHWQQNESRLYEMWAHFREQYRIGQPLKHLGYAAWDGLSFKPRFDRPTSRVLWEVFYCCFLAMRDIKISAAATYGPDIDMSGNLDS